MQEDVQAFSSSIAHLLHLLDPRMQPRDSSGHLFGNLIPQFHVSRNLHPSTSHPLCPTHYSPQRMFHLTSFVHPCGCSRLWSLGFAFLVAVTTDTCACISGIVSAAFSLSLASFSLHQSAYQTSSQASWGSCYDSA